MAAAHPGAQTTRIAAGVAGRCFGASAVGFGGLGFLFFLVLPRRPERQRWGALPAGARAGAVPSRPAVRGIPSIFARVLLA